jgi:hypothetical protein
MSRRTPRKSSAELAHQRPTEVVVKRYESGITHRFKERVHHEDEYRDRAAMRPTELTDGSHARIAWVRTRSDDSV